MLVLLHYIYLICDKFHDDNANKARPQKSGKEKILDSKLYVIYQENCYKRTSIFYRNFEAKCDKKYRFQFGEEYLKYSNTKTGMQLQVKLLKDEIPVLFRDCTRVEGSR